MIPSIVDDGGRVSTKFTRSRVGVALRFAPLASSSSMPAQSSLSAEEKTRVKSTLKGDKVLHAALARVYYAYPRPNTWSYTGLQGAIAFVKDESKATFGFKMVDLDGTRGIVWQHEFYEGLDYNPDRAFFHSFEGDVR